MNEIFIIDDNADDLFLLVQAFHEIGYDNIKTFQSPFLLMKHLYTLENNTLPCLIILDYNMPMLTGFNLVCFIRGKPMFRAIPLAVVTGSIWAGDVDRLVNAGVCKISLKPTSFDDYKIIAADLVLFAQPCLDDTLLEVA